MKWPRGLPGAHNQAHVLAGTLAWVCIALSACKSTPQGYRPAMPVDIEALDALERSLTNACALRAGAFLADVRPHGGGLSFQMEGVWQRDNVEFEAQVLSPLGEAWAEFALRPEGNSVSYDTRLGPEARDALSAFVSSLSALGAANLRAVSCGSGLLNLEKRSAWVADEMDAPAGRLDGNAPALPASPDGIGASPVGAPVARRYLLRGELDVAGDVVRVENRVDAASGDVHMEARVEAGPWGLAGGRVAWRGRTPAAPSVLPGTIPEAPRPNRLVVERDGRQGATLTFLEFE